MTTFTAHASDVLVGLSVRSDDARLSPLGSQVQAPEAKDPTLGILQIDFDRRIHYANAAALRILGSSDYRGLTLDSIFPDKAAQAILEEHLQERRAGAITHYRITARRLDDQRAVPLEITGLPLLDSADRVVGAIGVFRNLERRELANRIHRMNKEIAKGSQLLQAIGEALREVLPMDRMSVSRFSEDGAHINSFFVFGQHGNRVFQKRWWPLTPFQQRWIDDDANLLVRDVHAVMQEEPWKQFYQEPAVQEMLAAGIRSSLRHDVYRDGKRVGMVSLMSTKLAAFTVEHRALLEALPIDAAVIQALHFAERSRLEQRVGVLKALNRCVTIESACHALAESLVRMFGWAHVSIFRVDRAAGLVRMVVQHWDKAARIRLPDAYAQAVGQGLLGNVIETKSMQNVGNVQEHPSYVRGVQSAEVKSELCVPILDADHRDVRWIINVEDLQESAFATDECAEVQDLAAEASGVLQRISQLYFLTQCFEHTSDPIIVTDAHLRITKANPAAAALLAFDDARRIAGNLVDLIADADLPERLARDRTSLGEFSLRRVGEGAGSPDATVSTVPVFLTRQSLPEDVGGWIFVARDMRSIRRAVELELLEKAAYEVAIETSSPLALAMAELQRLMRADPPNASALAKVLHRLSRVRDGYTKLALYNASARPKEAHRYRIDLSVELESVAEGLTDSERALLRIEIERPLPVIHGDHFQIAVILEALLASLIRSAPEDDPVVARVARTEDQGVQVRLSGRVAQDGPGTEREASRIESEVRMAYQLIEDFMQNHGGLFEIEHTDKGRLEFSLVFPRSSEASS